MEKKKNKHYTKGNWGGNEDLAAVKFVKERWEKNKKRATSAGCTPPPPPTTTRSKVHQLATLF